VDKCWTFPARAFSGLSVCEAKVLSVDRYKALFLLVAVVAAYAKKKKKKKKKKKNSEKAV
jgi:hypothetical protein